MNEKLMGHEMPPKPEGERQDFYALNINSTHITEDPETGIAYSETADGTLAEIPNGTILYEERESLDKEGRLVREPYATDYIDEQGRRQPFTKEDQTNELPHIVSARIAVARGLIDSSEEPSPFLPVTVVSNRARVTQFGDKHLSSDTLQGRSGTSTTSPQTTPEGFNQSNTRGRRHRQK